MNTLTAARITATALLVLGAGLGCGGGSNTSGGGGSNGSGSGEQHGSIAGHALDRVGSAYLIGQSDDPANTIVIYIFDASVSCGDLSSPGWDARVADGTGSLELKLIGTKTGTYPTSKGPSPTAGSAAVNFTVTSTHATPAEERATGGAVTLGTLDAQVDAKGTFDLTFPEGTAKGSFDVAFCADGHEP